MKILFKGKDGGPESRVWGYWLFESKSFGSIVLLNFKEGSREAFHTHAFNALSWVLSGKIQEELLDNERSSWTFVPNFEYTPSIKPIYTPKDRFHRVFGIATNTWILSFRGPWVSTWKEWLPKTRELITLTKGRKVIVD